MRVDRWAWFVVLVACGGPAPWSESARVAGRSEIVPIGTLHRGHDRSEDYPAALVGELVAQSAPDVVFVEVPPAGLARVVDAVRESRPDPWTDALPGVAAAIRVALARDLPIEAVSGWSRQAADARLAYFAEHPEGPDDRTYRRAAEYRARRFDREGEDPEWVLGPLYRRLSAWTERALMTAAGQALGDAHRSVLWPRHRRLFEEAAKRHEGARIALVFGARDLFIFERLIADSPELHRIDARGILLGLDD